MSPTPAQMVGNWVTEGVQSGWPPPASGGWRGNLVIRADGTTTMNFTDGNIAPSRNGDWRLVGQNFSIIDREKTLWRATVTNTTQMGGDYDSGPAGAPGGSWSARRV